MQERSPELPDAIAGYRRSSDRDDSRLLFLISRRLKFWERDLEELRRSCLSAAVKGTGINTESGDREKIIALNWDGGTLDIVHTLTLRGLIRTWDDVRFDSGHVMRKWPRKPNPPNTAMGNEPVATMQLLEWVKQKLAQGLNVNPMFEELKRDRELGIVAGTRKEMRDCVKELNPGRKPGPKS